MSVCAVLCRVLSYLEISVRHVLVWGLLDASGSVVGNVLWSHREYRTGFGQVDRRVMRKDGKKRPAVLFGQIQGTTYRVS